MVQALLIIIGLVVLVKGNFKASKTKEIVRPQSIYLGLVFIGYGIASAFVPTTKIIYSLVFYASLIVIALIFAAKGKKITPDSAVAGPTNKTI